MKCQSFFGKIKTKLKNMLSAEFGHRVVKVK